MPEYTLTMSSRQAREVRKAVELLMRLKLGQYDVLPENILISYDHSVDDYCKRRDDAKPYLKLAFDAMEPPREDMYSSGWRKDAEWHLIYDLYQVVRKAIHDAEHPEGTGVDSQTPMRFGDEPMAKCEWRISK